MKKTITERVRNYYAKNPDRWMKGDWAREVLHSSNGFHFKRPKVCYCLEGAACAVTKGGFIKSAGVDGPVFTISEAGCKAIAQLNDELCDRIAKISRGRYDSVVGWNDARGRTVEQILKLLDDVVERQHAERKTA